jgi:hypothetical protein
LTGAYTLRALIIVLLTSEGFEVKSKPKKGFCAVISGFEPHKPNIPM